jgi:ABC-type lipoprotein export system ATPase subunit
MEMFKALNRNEKITIVMVTHEREIAEYAQRIIILRDGVVSDVEEVTVL